MRRLLLISYYYPPVAGSGVFRPLRLSKYLGRYGWDVTVLTVSERVRLLKDRSLLTEVPDEVRVERTAALEPRTLLLTLGKLGLGALARRVEPWFMIPDEQRGWVPFAIRRARRLLTDTPYDAILSTSSPYSAHLIGLALKRRFGVPWVADFRDEWTTNPYLHDRFPTAWHGQLNQRLERAVLTHADRVVSVSPPWLLAHRSLVPELDPGKFRVHENGFDGEHFAGPPPPRPDRFRVLYTGTFYGHRTPTTFLKAIELVLADGRVAREDLEVLLVGHTGAGTARDERSQSQVRVIEHRPYREVLSLYREAAVLLLVIPRAGGAGNHTGKIFNYLATGRPILALAPEPNIAADLIRASRSGLVVPPDDPVSVARALTELYEVWRSGRPLLKDQDQALIAGYEARPQAERFARLLDELVRPTLPRGSGTGDAAS